MTIETVKEVNGIKIERYEGTHKPYFVNLKDKGFYSFQSAKKAELFIVCITSK